MVSMLLTICSLFLTETILSLDNAAILALIVRDLPERNRPRALKYGIAGAFVMRGASLFFVSLIIRLWWLKALGGIYLLYLTFQYFFKGTGDAGSVRGATDRKIYRFLAGVGISQLWATIVLVELVDLSFSVDNILASVAMTSNLILVLIGVFIGMIAVRFMAQAFGWLTGHFPSLERSAFIVIGLLGGKLICQCFIKAIDNGSFDLLFGSVMIVVFIFPILKSKSWMKTN
jgi:YkoY family integral membrane protein